MSFLATIFTIYWLSPFIIRGIIALTKNTFKAIIFIIKLIINLGLKCIKNLIDPPNIYEENKYTLNYADLVRAIYELIQQVEDTSLSSSLREEKYLACLRVIHRLNEISPKKEKLNYSSFLNSANFQTRTVH